MTDLFPRVSGLKQGYDTAEVEEFFSNARHAYERPAIDEHQMTSLDVRRQAFDIKRGGYATAAVDSALDRLETAFSKRVRDQFVRQNGQDAWMQQLAQNAQVLYPRLRRPAGERFAQPSALSGGYDKDQVDELVARIIAFFDKGTPLTADEIRATTFKRRPWWAAYDERIVDAYLARAVDIFLGIA